MESATRDSVRAIAGQVAAIVGVVHLGLGTYYTVGGPAAVARDPRVVVWTVAGAVLVGGVAVGALGRGDRRLYAAGVAVVGGLLAAQFLWPALGGGALYLGTAPGRSLGDPLGYAAARLFEARPVARMVVALEVVLLALLVVLLADDGPR